MSSRCWVTSKTSLKIGAGKPWPHISPCSRRTVSIPSVAVFQRAVGVQGAQEFVGRNQLPCNGLEFRLEFAQVVFGQGQSGRGRVAAEALQQLGMALGHQIERVAQVQAGNRAAGAFEFAFVAAGEGEGRAVQLLLDAAGEDADHALVPVRVEQRQAGAALGIEVFEQDVGRLAHVGFDGAALAVDARRARRAMLRARAGSSVISASMPSDMSASRPAALRRGPRAKPRSKVPALRRIAAGDGEQGLDARLHAACADARQPLGDQDAVVAVQRHHVGDGAQRHQIEQVAEVGLRLRRQKRRAGAVRRAAPA